MNKMILPVMARKTPPTEEGWICEEDFFRTIKKKIESAPYWETEHNDAYGFFALVGELTNIVWSMAATLERIEKQLDKGDM